jgi:hypothetical protein
VEIDISFTVLPQLFTFKTQNSRVQVKEISRQKNIEEKPVETKTSDMTTEAGAWKKDKLPKGES